MQSESGGDLEEEVVPGCSSAPFEFEMGIGKEKVGYIEKENVKGNLPQEMELEQPGGVESGILGKETEKQNVNEGKENLNKPLFSEVLKNRRDTNTGNRNYFDNRRKNVVRLIYEGNTVPDREWVGKFLLINSLGFSAMHVYALIHLNGSRVFDISFRHSTHLETFWARYERVKTQQVWNDFTIHKISQHNVRTITILFNTEIVPEADSMFWLKRQTTVIGDLHPIYDKNGFWNGGYRAKIQLEEIENKLVHLPNTINIGRDRGWLFYPGQPKNCHKCRASDHFSATCTSPVCKNCGQSGHYTRECRETPVCNLCKTEGHYYINCPHSATNNPQENIITVQEYNELSKETAQAKAANETKEKISLHQEADMGAGTITETASKNSESFELDKEGFVIPKATEMTTLEAALTGFGKKTTKMADMDSGEKQKKGKDKMEDSDLERVPPRDKLEIEIPIKWSDSVEEMNYTTDLLQGKKNPSSQRKKRSKKPRS
nr:PREDICTED: zinc finger CCHC domain-containing protein 3 [Latimeria chalumnae]|eukprot:XP_014348280.1 PREDICTED: zinc finger CCHC domain-containing protein 3 [Latimeria chalumnae]